MTDVAPSVRVADLTKLFNTGAKDTVALDRLSFEARPGEIFGLLGPNGAGKTTALRILSTVLKPTSGTAHVAGFDVTTHPREIRRRIGFLSSSTNIYDRMSAWELVEYFGRLHGLDGDPLRQRMEHVFALLQMNDFRVRSSTIRPCSSSTSRRPASTCWSPAR